MKHVTVTASFPEEVVEDNIVVEANASTLKAACSRAIGNVLKSPELKRKRINNFSINIDVQQAA